jgi:hypothetical protein
MPRAPMSKELEDYAQLYFKYSVIIEEQCGAIQQQTGVQPQTGVVLSNETMEAYAIVNEEHNERRRLTLSTDPLFDPSIEELQNTLKHYGGLCEIPPQTLLELS